MLEDGLERCDRKLVKNNIGIRRWRDTGEIKVGDLSQVSIDRVIK
jgi:hypothetical protein